MTDKHNSVSEKISCRIPDAGGLALAGLEVSLSLLEVGGGGGGVFLFFSSFLVSFLLFLLTFLTVNSSSSLSATPLELSSLSDSENPFEKNTIKDNLVLGKTTPKNRALTGRRGTTWCESGLVVLVWVLVWLLIPWGLTSPGGGLDLGRPSL